MHSSLSSVDDEHADRTFRFEATGSGAGVLALRNNESGSEVLTAVRGGATYLRGGARAPPPSRSGSGRNRPDRREVRAPADDAASELKARQRQPGTPESYAPLAPGGDACHGEAMLTEVADGVWVR